jgi:hypothetical protein
VNNKSFATCHYVIFPVILLFDLPWNAYYQTNPNVYSFCQVKDCVSHPLKTISETVVFGQDLENT